MELKHIEHIDKSFFLVNGKFSGYFNQDDAKIFGRYNPFPFLLF